MVYELGQDCKQRLYVLLLFLQVLLEKVDQPRRTSWTTAYDLSMELFTKSCNTNIGNACKKNQTNKKTCYKTNLKHLERDIMPYTVGSDLLPKQRCRQGARAALKTWREIHAWATRARQGCLLGSLYTAGVGVKEVQGEQPAPSDWAGVFFPNNTSLLNKASIRPLDISYLVLGALTAELNSQFLWLLPSRG